MVQTLGQIQSLLRAQGLRPKRSMGQNFLHDAAHMTRIVEAASISPDDVVLEVGPGTGSLSQAMLEAGARLVAVELDRQLIPILQQQLASFGQRATLLHMDVLSGKHAIDARVVQAVDAMREQVGQTRESAPGATAGESAPGDMPQAQLGPRANVDRPSCKLVANLPYQVASPLLANLAEQLPHVDRAIVMVQREVAQRLTADQGGKAMGPLTVMVQAAWHVESLWTLPPGCFWHPPAVDSAVVRMVRRQVPLSDDLASLRRQVQRIFQARRKQLGSTLRRLPENAWPQGIEPRQRAEQLAVHQVIDLAHALRQQA